MDIFSKIWKKLTGWLTPKQEINGVNVEKKGTNQGVPIVYGFQKKAKSIKVFKATTDSPGASENDHLHLICVFCTGEIENIGQLYFNDIPESQIDSERFYIERFTGSATQAYSATLNSNFNQWKSTAKLKNVAYAYVRLRQNNKVNWWQGEPEISADISGLKVLDPRDGLAKYSDNAALCAYDYLTNEYYGKGLLPSKINTQSFIAAADFIETTRTYTRTVYKTEYDRETRTWLRYAAGTVNETITENLMSCNVSLDPEKTIKQNVETLLSGMRAILPETNGQYRIAIEKDDIPVFAFTKDNLIGAIQCQGGNQSDRYNQVIIRFRNILTGEDDEAVFPSDDVLHQQWKTEDNGKLLLGEFDFETINNKAEALQMGHVIAYRSRNLLGAMFNGIPETIVVEAGDVVTIDSKILGWNAKPFRIESVDIDAIKSGECSFQAVEHQNNIYPWAIGDVTEEYVDTSFALPQNINAPTGLTFNAINNDNLKQGKLTWDDANNTLVTFYRVTILDSTLAVVKSTDITETFLDIYGLESGSHTFKVYSGNSLNLSQNATLVVTLTKTTVGWNTVVGTEALFNDARISNAAITGFVTDALYENEKAALQAQIDKAITTWFYDGAPTLANAPANTWATNEEKNVHLGDLYYDNLTGYAYRFLINVTVYQWTKVSDSDVTKALANAANAQDTADSKRRVFVAQPVTPYDIGDLWDVGGAILRCNTAKTIGGVFSAGDWLLVSDTTDYDDTRVSNDYLKIGGQNLVLNSKIAKAGSTYNVLYFTANRDFVAGEELRVTVWGSIIGSKLFGLWFNSYSFDTGEIPLVSPGVYSKTITVPINTSTRGLGLFLVNNASNTDSWTFTAIKVEKGNKATDWSEAPEDTQAKADLAEANAISTAATAAQAKADLAETTAKAYADGVVDAEEARAIADAQAKADTAQANAITAAAITAQAKADLAEANAISTAATAAQAKADLAETTAKAYADGVVDAEEARAIADAQAKADAAQANAISAAAITAQAKADAAQANAISTAATAAQAKADLAKTQAQAYADGVVDAEETRAIADAQAKADAAQAAAIAAAKLNLSAGVSVTDTRSTNENPDFYYLKGKGTYAEFKTRATIGALGTPVYGLLTTFVPWQDSSGGKIVQYVNNESGTQKRTSVNNTTWNQWKWVLDGDNSPIWGVDIADIPDQQFMPNLVSAGAGTALNINPLSAADVGSTTTITIAAHTRQYGFGLLSLNAGSITGLAFSTKYYVYYDDASYLGGAVTYQATTNLQTIAAGNNRIFVSTITTPANGGGGTLPPSDWCISLDMWLTQTLQAELVSKGDELDLWWQGNEAVKGKVLQAKKLKQKQVVYEIETDSGAIVRVSESTPLEFENHVIITPKELVVGSDKLATLKNNSKKLVWETVIRAEIIGEREVMHISVGNGSFAAGLDPKNRIITHNAQVKP